MQFITRNILKRLESMKHVIEGRETAWRAIIIQPNGVKSKNVDRFALELRIFFENDKSTFLFALPSGGFLFFSRGVKNEELEIVRMMAIEILEVEGKNVVLHDMSLTKNVVYDFMNSCEAFFDIDEKNKQKTKDSSAKKPKKALAEVIFDDDPQILVQMNYLRASRKELHIMLVDDDQTTLRMVELLLSPTCNVVKYENAFEALDDYVTYAPHIVFLDINMPEYSGHDILKMITKYDKDAFVVMLSGNAYPEDIKESMSHGSSGFIGKPFSKGKIFDYLETYKKRYNFQEE